MGFGGINPVVGKKRNLKFKKDDHDWSGRRSKSSAFPSFYKFPSPHVDDDDTARRCRRRRRRQRDKRRQL